MPVQDEKNLKYDQEIISHWVHNSLFIHHEAKTPKTQTGNFTANLNMDC